ncbi:MAG TPA: hypothetical protein VIM38_05515 [Alphaproteobacteria bacterium]
MVQIKADRTSAAYFIADGVLSIVAAVLLLFGFWLRNHQRAPAAPAMAE